MASFKTRQQEAFEDLGITRDEFETIGEAFKKEEFRKLFSDYVNEITDPENQKKFEEEITELERERGNDVTFIHPQPGYVVKTSVNGEKKAFINVCCNNNIGKPSAIPNAGGLHWSIPYTQAPPRDDMDKKNNLCLVFDVVFHPDTIQMSKGNNKFKEMVTETALNAVEESYKVTLDKQNIRYPNIQFKGMKKPTVIRRRSKKPALQSDSQDLFEIPNYPYTPIDEDHNVNIKETKVSAPTKQVNAYTTPKYILKQRKNIDMQECTNSMTSKLNSAIPHELVVTIELPLIKSASDVTLDVTEKSLKLVSEKPAKYKLDITLPYSVNEDEGNAKFDCTTKQLTVTLAVKFVKKVQNIFELAREDSGVDSDTGSGSRSTESSSEDEPLKDPPLIEEVENCDKSISDSGYRTNCESDEFLSSEKHYSLPQYDFNVLHNMLAFTLHVKNVEPDSVESRHLDSTGFHLKFTSIGSGYYPIHYSFCVKFPSGVNIDNENLNVEVWDNNVIAQISLINCDNGIWEYFYGINEDSLEKTTLPNPIKLMKDIQDKAANVSDPPSVTTKVEVLKFEENNVVFEITNEQCSNATQESNNETDCVDVCEPSSHENESEKEEIEIKEVSESVKKVEIEKAVELVASEAVVQDNKNDKSDEIKKETVEKKVEFALEKNEIRVEVKSTGFEKSKEVKSHEKKMRRLAARTMSESHSDKSEPKPYRGILKIGRSLSESSADDYQWSSSSVDSSDPNCAIVEKTKKTVRFNDLISKKIYRLDSSILGQRKKNQRKSRNKKRAQENRHTSESENSEADPDENFVQTNGKGFEVDSSESQSDVSQSDVSQSDVSESDDGMTPEHKPDVMSMSKRNPHKKGGKKSARKSANTAKMAFTNNLMFDLDM